ncbi:hypothetical protein F5876DRAFT_65623 [Lentinula aff. lateritia]|uniref:Uncharacterized protein n=1 Tax=Lentinula aff. lateritia TaxID=2804960 RepID=A0ACC1U086_9AGAR|nr:hypothetical protein F5876DRAFT_65623 [Lentinula aff. lateritia]
MSTVPLADRTIFLPSQFNLAWKLVLVQKTLTPQSLLNSYSQERVPVINKTIELFRKEFVRKADQKKEFVREYELHQLGINHRGTPVVSDEKYTDKDEANDPYRSGNDGTVRAGDRAPDAPYLAQLGHSALVFPSCIGRDFVDEVSGILRGYPSNLLKSILILPRTSSDSSFTLSDTTLVDIEGHVHSGYDVAHDPPAVSIVRPDGYVGASVTSGRLGMRIYFLIIFSVL